MKSAEEWAESYPIILTNPSNKQACVDSYRNFIKQIQLDAYKQGMTDASQLVGMGMTAEQTRQHILTARDNKTNI